MRRIFAVLVGFALALLAVPAWTATVTEGANVSSTNYGEAKLDSDYQLKQRQGRRTTTIYPAGTTSSARGGDTVSLTSADFCASGSNAIVCTGTDSKVATSVLPTSVVTSTSTGTGTKNVTAVFDGSTGVTSSPFFAVAIPTVVGRSVTFASVTNTNHAVPLRIELAVHSDNFPQSKIYDVATIYLGTTSTWQALRSVASSGRYSTGNDAVIDLYTGAGTSYLRVRRVSGTTAGTAYITVASLGDPPGNTVAASTALCPAATPCTDVPTATYAGSASFVAQQPYTITLPTTVGQSVVFAKITNIANFAAPLRMEYVTHSDNFPQSKIYDVALIYNGTVGVWQALQPMVTSGAYAPGGSQDAALDVYVLNGIAYFRARRVYGTAAGTAYVTIEPTGDIPGTFVESDLYSLCPAATPCTDVPTSTYSGSVVSDGASRYSIVAGANVTVAPSATATATATSVLLSQNPLVSAKPAAFVCSGNTRCSGKTDSTTGTSTASGTGTYYATTDIPLSIVYSDTRTNTVSSTATGTGSTNYGAKFDGAGGIKTSLYYDDGTKARIGTLTSASTFTVGGSIRSVGGAVVADTSYGFQTSGYNVDAATRLVSLSADTYGLFYYQDNGGHPIGVTGDAIGFAFGTVLAPPVYFTRAGGANFLDHVRLRGGASTTYYGVTSGSVQVYAPATVTSYGLTWPTAQATNANYSLCSTGANAALQWCAPGLSGNGVSGSGNTVTVSNGLVSAVSTTSYVATADTSTTGSANKVVKGTSDGLIDRSWIPPQATGGMTVGPNSNVDAHGGDGWVEVIRWSVTGSKAYVRKVVANATVTVTSANSPTFCEARLTSDLAGGGVVVISGLSAGVPPAGNYTTLPVTGMVTVAANTTGTIRLEIADPDSSSTPLCRVQGGYDMAAITATLLDQ